jgi:hypothetical protein
LLLDERSFDVTEFPQEPPGAAPPYPPAASYAAVGGNDPNPIEIGFAGPAPQQRVTVLVRLILVIPHLVVLWVLGIAAYVVGIIGWFGALFTGRLPDFAAEYLTGYLRWQTRVNAYHLLLTDQYPPFSLEDADYPTRLAARPGQLNRLAVFFRFILSIPASLLVSLVTVGAETLVLFVTWLIVLITGTMPPSLHQAYAAVVRYTIRLNGYTFLLTSQYPSGLFGDASGYAGGAGYAGAAGAAGAATIIGPEGTSFPPAGSAGREEPAGPPTMPGFPSPGGYQGGAPGYQDPAQGYQGYQGQAPAFPPGGPMYPMAAGGSPALGWAVPGNPPWPLVLSSGARKLIGLFIALGALLIVGYVVLIVAVVGSSSSPLTRADAIISVQSANITLSRTLTAFPAKTSACASSQQPLKCVTNLDKQVASAFDAFGNTVRSTSMPSAAASTTASQLASAAARAGQVFQRLGSATSVAQYQSLANGSNIQQIVDQVSQDYQHLGVLLNGP